MSQDTRTYARNAHDYLSSAAQELSMAKKYAKSSTDVKLTEKIGKLQTEVEQVRDDMKSRLDPKKG